jgi:mannosyltransferase
MVHPLRNAVVACSLLAAAVRLPGLGAHGLAPAEQTAFVESQGLSARAALWTRATGTSETALRLPSALAGTLAAALAALVAGQLAGPLAAAWAGGLVALSPIHALASREAGSDATFVLVLLAALAALFRVETSGSRLTAAVLGLALGVLSSSGVAAFATVAALSALWLTLRADRRGAAGLAIAVAAGVVAGAAHLGLARSPLDYGEVPSWIPGATASGILRCTGASFTRLAGIEYHLVTSHARYALPLTALLVGLMARGAARLPPRARRLLVAGAVLPFAVGATLALATARVLPLQATRLLAALPFLALLTATGLASLRGWRAWAAGTAVAGSLAALLSLALAR